MCELMFVVLPQKKTWWSVWFSKIWWLIWPGRFALSKLNRHSDLICFKLNHPVQLWGPAAHSSSCSDVAESCVATYFMAPTWVPSKHNKLSSFHAKNEWFFPTIKQSEPADPAILLALSPGLPAMWRCHLSLTAKSFQVFQQAQLIHPYTILYHTFI